jgi:hypothetical protein
VTCVQADYVASELKRSLLLSQLDATRQRLKDTQCLCATLQTELLKSRASRVGADLTISSLQSMYAAALAQAAADRQGFALRIDALTRELAQLKAEVASREVCEDDCGSISSFHSAAGEPLGRPFVGVPG